MIEIVPNWHPLFVHFTVALLSLSVIFFIIQRPLAETEIGDNFLIFARYSLGLGIFFTVITVIAGIDAYNTVDHDTPSHLAMKDHRLWALTSAGVFFIAWIWSLLSLKRADKAGLALIIILLVGAGLLVNAGHKGSLLVYYYGLGVESMPDTDEHDHKAHDHKGGHDHGEQLNEKPHDHSIDAQGTSSEHNHSDLGEAGEEAHGHSNSLDVQTGDSHEHSPVATTHNDGHDHSHIDSPPAVEMSAEPEVITDKDGIIRESLPEVDLPVQKEAE